MDSPDKVITAVDAARRIYNTTAPSAEQVGRVVQKLAAGSLKRSDNGGPTTTIASVAEYLARREEARSQAPGRRNANDLQAAAHRGVAGNVYRGLLKDYFLAVVLRRRAAHRSGGFQQAVLATQFLLLIVCSCLLYVGATRAWQFGHLPPDHAAIHSWLKTKFDESRVKTIRPDPHRPGAYRTQYSYQVNGRIIQSEASITVRGGQVTGVSSE